MKKITILSLSLLLLFVIAQPVLANQPPGPNLMLSEVLILPAMIILTLIGGGYAVLSRLKGKKRPLLKIIAAILAIIFSAMQEGLAFLVVVIFAVIALERSLKMLYWGIKSIGSNQKPEHLTEAKPSRLISAGAILFLVTIFLAGMAVAFVTYWPEIGQERRETNLKKFLTYQLAYAQIQKSKTGNITFDETVNYDDLNIEYGVEDKSFTVYMLPVEFPFFPYSYLTSQPSYRADETGQVRMIYVHKKEILCPPDAPVVWKISDQEIQDMITTIKSDIP